VKPLILVVDDDRAIRDALRAELESLGYQVAEATNGEEGVRVARDAKPDLILSDLAMPVADGFHLIEAVRRQGQIPILVLSVRGGETDKVRALDLGADDYVTKPFSPGELLARVRAQLRRTKKVLTILQFPDLTIDVEKRFVRQGDRDVKLTPTEFAILQHVAANAGRPVSVQELIRVVWHGAPGTTSDVVRVHVGSLRRKLEPDATNPRYLVTEPWVGYRFIAEPE
jgi:two-component system KDP operon response regulator KdpE